MQDNPTTKQLHTIYCLVDPRSHLVRYIGVTCTSLAERLRGHLKESHAQPKTRRARWIRQLAEAGLRPHIFPLEQTGNRLRECYWIAFYRSMGFNLTNLTDGGEGVCGLKCSQSAKLRIREIMVEKWQSPEYRQHMSQVHKGQLFTKEHRSKLSATSRGRRHTEYTRQKMSKPKTEQHKLHAKEGRRLVLATGMGRACGEKNGMKKHPGSVLRGSANPIAKINEDQVREMRRKYIAGGCSTNTLAREYDLSQATIWRIVKRKSWKHVL